MISLILYGRNDNYGYNLHKRAAISLNCMAELLDDPDDEILFVDYNTPDDMPTFVEAILDTLTDRARAMLRVLRVRPSVHRRWAGKTHLNALEPPARNIALRRSNPKNRWILSTNTDMVFVMRDGAKSLSQTVKDLPDGYYGIPRFEMPESLWESLDRKDPQAVIAAFARWGKALHLDEVVHSHKSILYDAPGDFQLVPRADMFKIHGFSEAMLLGWHVDSNLAKRCLLLYGGTKSLFHKAAGYHCDHTKVATPMHGHDRQQNDMVEHITEVRSPYLPKQADDWGAPDAAIEDLRFPPGRDTSFAAAIAPLLGPMPKPIYEVTYTEKSWNQITYPARHVIPYLADQIATFPRDIDLAYAGLNDTLRALLAETWRALGFTGRLLVHRGTAGVKPGCETPPSSDAPFVVADLEYMIEHATLFILDLGVEDGSGWPIKSFHSKNPKSAPLLPYVKAIQAAGLEVAAAERQRLADRMPARRIIFVNTINGELAGQAEAAIGQTITPFCTRVRHGTLKPDAGALPARHRVEAERSAMAAAKSVVAMANRPLPFELLDRSEPHALLDEEQRAAVAGTIPTREFEAPWRDVAILTLGMALGDFDRRLEAYLASSPDEPAAFLERLIRLRTVAAEAMARPWPEAHAAVIARACGAFLERLGPLPGEWRSRVVDTMMGMCRGASGAGLGALAERIVAHAGEVVSSTADPSDKADAWIAICAAEFALCRPPWSTDAARVDQLRERILGPALARLAAPPPKSGNDARLAVIATAPYAMAVDPAATRLAEVMTAVGAPASVRIFALQPPDTGFLAQATQRKIEVATVYNPNGLLASHAAGQSATLVGLIRGWQPGAAIGVGDGALVAALLAQGLAPRQATYGNRLVTGEMTPAGRMLADRAALDAWLASGAGKPKGGTVGVAAR